MQKLTINGRFTTQSLTGVQRYAWEMVRAIDKILAKRECGRPLDVTLLLPPGPDLPEPFLAIQTRRVGTRQGHTWEQLDLPRYTEGFLLNLCNTYPLMVRHQLCVIHDASIYARPQGYTLGFIAFYKFLFKMARMKPGLLLVTSSQFSRREIAKYSSIDSPRLQVIYLGADHWHRIEPDTTIVERLHLTDRPYVLAVASENNNKNIRRLIAAFTSLGRKELRLVLAGGRNNQVFAATEHDDPDEVIRTGYISDPELAALYSNARCFVFPSLYEGFGLPPLEAMYFGCPVISSREASLPEVGGEAVLYCNAFDADDIARQIQRVFDDPDERAWLREQGYRQVKKFVWAESARAMLNLIDRAS